MCERVVIVYNEPVPSRYDATDEEKAVLGVMEAVAAIYCSLLELGYDVIRIPLSPPIQIREKLNGLKADLVFNLFEGFPGYPETEAIVPDILSDMGIPFTGCTSAALRLALDKAKTKVILRAAGVPTPDFQLLNPETVPQFRLAYPCIVKPCSEDASHGLSEGSVVSDFTSLKEKVGQISGTYGGQALVEEFIGGREFNVTIMGNTRYTMLPVSEISYSLPEGMPQILTFAAKWQPDSPYFEGTRVICPAEIGSEYQKRIESMTLGIFYHLGCQGYARVDMRMDKAGRLNVIEVNPNPDISPDAGTIRQAKAANMTYTEFIKKIVQTALEKGCYDHKGTPHVEERQTGPHANPAGYARVQAI